MKLSDFGYILPQELIAQRPLLRRDQARLLIVDRKTQKISHDIFANVGDYLPKESLIILNDSKVIPARLFGRREKTAGEVEIFLLKKIDEHQYQTLLRPLKRLKTGEKIILNGSELYAQIEDIPNRLVSFSVKNIESYLDKIGHMPLPLYIKRMDEPLDQTFYQTVYAKKDGSVAAPTAGLHFTKKLLAQFKKERHSIGYVTLHVNYATFKPVKEEDITRHKMHTEDYEISDKTLAQIKQAKENGQKIVAVGTTSCRVLETLANTGQLQGTTNLFIYPRYSFKMVDALITNFHFPFSTLLMLVYAFGGQNLVKKAYAEAMAKKYRFFSYGDAMVIL